MKTVRFEDLPKCRVRDYMDAEWKEGFRHVVMLDRGDYPHHVVMEDGIPQWFRYCELIPDHITQDEFESLKPGDVVRIVSEKIGDCWNPSGKIDKWLGKEITIACRSFNNSVACRENSWNWFPQMIASIVSRAPEKKKRQMTHAEVFRALSSRAVVRYKSDGSSISNHWSTNRYVVQWQICYNYTGTDSDVWEPMEVEE